MQGHVLDTDIREYGFADGLRGIQGVKRDRSVIRDSQGNIWFSFNFGLSVVHPSRADSQPAPAMAHVESVSINGNPVSLQGPVRIPSTQRRIVIDYSALSLTAAGQLRFRYRLDGFDHGWSEPVITRQAVYTNLGPGSYRFRVAASTGSRFMERLRSDHPLQDRARVVAGMVVSVGLPAFAPASVLAHLSSTASPDVKTIGHACGRAHQ